MGFHIDACEPGAAEGKGKVEAKVRLSRLRLDPTRRPWEGLEELQERTDRSRRLGHTDRVGGIYDLRHAPDDPKPFNRDDYALVPSPRDPERLWLEGSFRHPTEHWADHDEVRELLNICII